MNYIRSGYKSRGKHIPWRFLVIVWIILQTAYMPRKEHASLCFLRGNGRDFDCASNREFSCTADFEGKRKRTEDWWNRVSVADGLGEKHSCGRTREFQWKVWRSNRFFLIVWPVSCSLLLLLCLSAGTLQGAGTGWNEVILAIPLEEKAKADSWFLHRDLESIVPIAALTGGAAIKWSCKAETGHTNMQDNCL